MLCVAIGGIRPISLALRVNFVFLLLAQQCSSELGIVFARTSVRARGLRPLRGFTLRVSSFSLGKAQASLALLSLVRRLSRLSPRGLRPTASAHLSFVLLHSCPRYSCKSPLFLSLNHRYLQRSQPFLLANLIFLYLDMHHLLPELAHQRVHLNMFKTGICPATTPSKLPMYSTKLSCRLVMYWW